MKKIIILFLAIGFLAAPGASAANLVFGVNSSKIREGRILKADLKIDPRGEKIYTVKVKVVYPAGSLDFVSFALNKDWMPVSVKDYDLEDRENGIIIKTAGIPGGVLEKTVLGTMTFKAKKEGRGEIRIDASSLALNADNKNTLSGGSGLMVTVYQQEPAAPAPPAPPVSAVAPEAAVEEESIPDRLFDIKMETDPNLLADSLLLSARVSLTNFGKKPTPIDLTFSIFDAKGEKVKEEKNSFTVETERLFVKRFKNLSLPPGEYRLILNTSYGDGEKKIKDEFRNNFTILKNEGQQEIFFWFLGIGILALLVLIFWLGNRFGAKSFLIRKFLKKRKNKWS